MKEFLNNPVLLGKLEMILPRKWHLTWISFFPNVGLFLVLIYLLYHFIINIYFKFVYIFSLTEYASASSFYLLTIGGQNWVLDLGVL